MASEDAVPDRLDVAAPRAKTPRGLDLTLSVNREAIKGLMDDVRELVRQIIRDEMAAHQPNLRAEQPSDRQAAAPDPPSPGIELPPEEPLKARDLRTALLLGKVPETAGLLIDAGTAAGLLSVSERTLYRLISEKAVPEPVRISGRLVRWRLAELLEWIEAGCPHAKRWSYSPTQGKARPRK